MRLLVLSDIHADCDGLELVLEAAEAAGWDRLVLLGDLIGYGNQPARTLDILNRFEPLASIGGNHELMLASLRAGGQLQASADVIAPLQQCLAELSGAQLDMLTSLPDHAEGDGWQAWHGSPASRFGYLLGPVEVRRFDAQFAGTITLSGHSHVPGAFVRDAGGRWQVRPARRELHSWELPGTGVLLNPGSVHLNRDAAGGRSFGILDTEQRIFTVQRLN